MHKHTNTIWIFRITIRIISWHLSVMMSKGSNRSMLCSFHSASSMLTNSSVSRFENCINRIFKHQNCKVFGSHLHLFGISFVVVWCILSLCYICKLTLIIFNFQVVLICNLSSTYTKLFGVWQTRDGQETNHQPTWLIYLIGISYICLCLCLCIWVDSRVIKVE